MTFKNKRVKLLAIQMFRETSPKQKEERVQIPRQSEEQ